MKYYDLLCNMCFSQHVASFGTWCQQLQVPRQAVSSIPGAPCQSDPPDAAKSLRRKGLATCASTSFASPTATVASGSHCDRKNSTPTAGLEVSRNAIYFAQVLTCLHFIPCAIFNDISPGYQNTEYIHFDTFLACQFWDQPFVCCLLPLGFPLQLSGVQKPKTKVSGGATWWNDSSPNQKPQRMRAKESKQLAKMRNLPMHPDLKSLPPLCNYIFDVYVYIYIYDTNDTIHVYLYISIYIYIYIPTYLHIHIST